MHEFKIKTFYMLDQKIQKIIRFVFPLFYCEQCKQFRYFTTFSETHKICTTIERFENISLGSIEVDGIACTM